MNYSRNDDTAEQLLFEFNKKFIELKENLDEQDSQNLKDIFFKINQLIQNIRQFPSDYIEDTEIVQYFVAKIDALLDNRVINIAQNMTIILFGILMKSREAINTIAQQEPVEFINKIISSDVHVIRRVSYLICERLLSDSLGFSMCNIHGIIDTLLNTLIMFQQDPPDDLTEEARETYISELLSTVIAITNHHDVDVIPQVRMKADMILTIVKNVFESKDYLKYVLKAIRILVNLTSLKMDKEVLNSGLFERAMQLLDDESCRSSYSSIIGLAAQLLYIRDNTDPREIYDKLPKNRFIELLLEAPLDDDSNLLTLFTNVVSIGEEAVELLMKQECLEKLFTYVDQGPPSISQSAIWCLWNMLRFGSMQHRQRIMETECFDIMLECFDSDDIAFLKDVLLPSIMDIILKIRESGQQKCPPFEEAIEKIEPRLTQLCYKEESPEIESIATSYLKNLFIESYNREGFL